MADQPKVCVVGSINMDMVTVVDTMPLQGETVLGGTFQTNPGGKGANQAVAAARLGADVSLIGAVGNDLLGNALLDHFTDEGIGTEYIRKLQGVSTGIATIIVSEQDNRIIVASGANLEVTPELVKSAEQAITESDIVLLQFEIPMETVITAVNLAYEHRIPVIVNPAPYQKIPHELFKKATCFTPNKGEAMAMQESPLYGSSLDKLIITKGKDGAEFLSPDGIKQWIPGRRVTVKDTTGAGDTFNGALAMKLARGTDLAEAVQFANAAAALSVSKFGAQAGMPTEEEVEAFLELQER